MPNTNASPKPSYDHCFNAVGEQLFGLTVDMSWLADYDQDMIDAAQAFSMYRAWRYSQNHGSDRFKSKEDLLVSIDSISKALADVLTAYRTNGKADSPLIALMEILVEQGYLAGVRDAYCERLSTEGMVGVAKGIDRRDERREQMREFYNDIRG